MVHCYTRYETINQFAIGYMIAPSLQKFLRILFDAGTMETIKYFMRKNNTCVMALMIIYENNGEIQKHFIECSVVLFILSYKIMFVFTIYCVDQKP